MKILRAKKPKKQRHRIAQLRMSSGRIVTDPAEIRRLLRAEGFTVDETTGRLGLGERLKRPQ